jgi:hypothetical protein
MKHTFLKLFTIFLMTILFLAIAPQILNAQTEQATLSQTELKQTTSPALLQSFNSMSLNAIGYKSEKVTKFCSVPDGNNERANAVYSIMDNGKSSEISISSSIQSVILNGTLKSYDYQAQILFSNGTISTIHESDFKRNVTNNHTTETLSTEINGPTKYQFSRVEDVFYKDNLAEKQRTASISYTNSTGSYKINLSCNSLWNVTDNSLINGTSDLYQNLVGQAGNYEFDFAAVSDSNKVQYNITLPDGRLVDPWLSYLCDSRFPLLLTGFEQSFAWFEWDTDIMAASYIAIACGFSVVGELGAVLFGVVAAIMGAQESVFVADMGGTDVIITYFEFVTVLGWLPLQVEMGFFTNQLLHQPLGDWYYYPQWSSMPLYYPHTCLWPWPLNDPPLTVLAYADSSSEFFEGVPVYIDSYFVGTTSSTIDLTPGTYTFEAPTYGKFAYFDVGGTPVYDNPATITLGNDPVTIVVHYYTSPMVTLTVDAYDTYNGGWINPYVSINGVASGYAPITVQVLPGYYDISFDLGYQGGLYLPWYSSITDGYTTYNVGDSIPISGNTEVTGLYTLGG